MATDPRKAYLDATVATASPEQLLVMLVDRLRLDVGRGLAAQESGRHEDAHGHLLHAQDIVSELRSSLQVDRWDGGPALAALYSWLTTHLVKANIERNPALTSECLALTDELAATWREAALRTAALTA